MNRRKATNSIVIFLCLLFFVAFSRDKATAQLDPIPLVSITSGESVGQTFTSLHRGLNEIGVTLSSESPVTGILKLDLYHNVSKTLLLSKEYSVAVSAPMYFVLEFETQTDSYLKDYFLELTWASSDPISFQTNAPESYSMGGLYINSSPVMSQLSFSLTYDRLQLSLGLILNIFKWLWQFFLTVLILVLPGWTILTYCWSGWKNYDFFLKLALTFGVSYALYPILFLFTDLLNFHPGEPFFVWTVMGLSAFFMITYYWPDLNHKKISIKKLVQSFQINSENWQNVLFIFILCIIFLVKFWAIRTLDTPMWGDSYQHTVITQLMLDNKGLFDSWQPYVPYESLTVHFGFHAISAVYAWISNQSASQSVLWIGQISNTLAALSLYPIAFKVSGNKKWAGIIAVILAGLALKYPNYYVNWGRYAQLSGQVLLPLVGFLLVESLFSNKNSIKNLAIVSLFLGGMALCYYRMPFFLIIWLPLLLGEMLVWFKTKENKFLPLFTRIALISLGMLVLLIPLFSRILGGTLAESVGYAQSPTFNEATSTFITNLKSTKEYYSQLLVILAVISAVFGLLMKQWRVLAIALGMVLLHAYNVGTFINLPFSNFIDNFSIQIMAYIGLSVTIAYLSALIFDGLEKIHHGIPVFLFCVISLFFAFTAKNVTDKKHEMVTRPDLRAFHWIVNNTDPDDLFLVNGFTIYNNTSGVGSDAGWWLSLLTDRENTMPPQYAVLNEKPESPDYNDWTVDVINLFETHPPISDEGKAAMCSWGIDYIYIGQKQGSVNDLTPLLNWQEWGNVPHLTLAFAEDHVRIYQFDSSLCVGSR
jgi:hypothetical protein